MEKEYPYYIREWAKVSDHEYDWVWVGIDFDPNKYDMASFAVEDDYDDDYERMLDYQRYYMPFFEETPEGPEDLCFESKEDFWSFVDDVLREQDFVFREVKGRESDEKDFAIFASSIEEDGRIGAEEEVIAVFPEYVKDGVLFGTMNILPVYDWDDIKVQIKNWE